MLSISPNKMLQTKFFIKYAVCLYGTPCIWNNAIALLITVLGIVFAKIKIMLADLISGVVNFSKLQFMQETCLVSNSIGVKLLLREFIMCINNPLFLFVKFVSKGLV